MGPGVDGGATPGPTDADAAAPCTGLSCQVNQNCPDGGTTTLTGTVYDPAGTTPLSGVTVFVPVDPQGPLPPLALGTGSCSASCRTAIATYVTATMTDGHGAFTITSVPTGKNIPVVIQVGKWRREIRVDTSECANTTVPASLTRLPRNQSEGDIPQMAIVTGACDELACFVRDIGLDATEFTGPSGGGRLHVYKGAGPGPDLAGGGAGSAGDCSIAGCPLWSTKSALEKYDLVLLGCECGEHTETKPDTGPMHDWLDEGGRVLATHYQDTWFKNGPADFQGVASWLASETNGPTPGPFQVDTTWVGGQALNAWLGNLGALNPDGTLPLSAADVSASVSAAAAGTQQWIDDESSPMDPKVLSFATPVGGLPLAVEGGVIPSGPYCGRAMFTDVHAGGGGMSSSAPVPASCAGANMDAEEKALEYLFFDLSGPCYVQRSAKDGPVGQ